MSVVLHYALPPGFGSTSGKVGLTPRRWPPSAHYSLGLDGGPSGRWLGGSHSAQRVDVEAEHLSILLRKQKAEETK